MGAVFCYEYDERACNEKGNASAFPFLMAQQ
jgi:hypothetical protein